jgi:hypothetical protein
MYRSRSTIAGFFFLLMLLPVCWFAALQIQQHVVQQEMLERLERAELETLSIPVASLIWYKKNKEILVNNQLFDVKSIRVVDGIAEIRGLFDIKENAIKKALSATGNHQQTGKLAGKFIALVLLHKYHSILTPANPDALNPVHFIPLKTNYNAPFRDHFTPPPRM